MINLLYSYLAHATKLKKKLQRQMITSSNLNDSSLLFNVIPSFVGK